MNPLKFAFCVQSGDVLGFVVHKKSIEINQNKTEAIREIKSPSAKKELQSLLGKFNFFKEVHFKPKWRDSSVLVITPPEEGRVHLEVRASKGF